VLVPDGEALQSPSTLELADALGLRTRADQPFVRPVHRGERSGRAGSRGVRRLRGVADRRGGAGRAGGPGGSERVDRKFPRVPKGLSGADLTHRAVAQAARFGAETVLAHDVGFGVSDRQIVRVHAGELVQTVQDGARLRLVHPG